MEITMPHKEKASEMKHYAGKAVFSAAIGHALDGLDLMILSFALSGIIATFGVDNATAGSLTSITLAGAFLGGLVFGTLADKLGRIRVLTYSVIFFGVFTLDVVYSAHLLTRIRQFAKENEVDIKVERLKSLIRSRQDERREKANFLFAFRSSHSLAEHLREAQEAWEERRKVEKK